MSYLEKSVERFLSKTNPDKNGCWIWCAGFGANNGYGMFHYDSKMVLSHRFSYEFFNGKIPEGFEIDHLCRIRKCVNPCHLEAVTQQVNIARMPYNAGIMHKNKTHCPLGHAYDDKNTIFGKDGGRGCRSCLNRQNREYRKRKSDARSKCN